MRIIIGIIIIAIGALITMKSEWIFQNFGTIPFFEEKFHSSGGGRFGYKIIGIISTFIGILILTNLHRNIILSILSLFPGIGGPAA